MASTSPNVKKKKKKRKRINYAEWLFWTVTSAFYGTVCIVNRGGDIFEQAACVFSLVLALFARK